MSERSRSKTGSRRPQAAATTGVAEKPSLRNLLKLRDDTAQPLYQQLEDQLTALIVDETLAAGTTLPAERQLAENLNISRATVQRSYNTLRQRKLLSAHGRLGSIVQGTGSRLHPGMDRLKGFTEEMRELGREPSSVIIERAVGGDRSIASIFGLPSHARFLKLIRVRSGDGVPMSREVAWYNLSAAPGLTEKDLSQSLYAHLRSEGVPPTHCEQTIEAAAPTPQECELFGFSEPIPCLLIKRRSYTWGNTMVEYVEGLFRGDAYTYRIALKA
jgi:GntR family transcriptional regulator